MQGPFSDKSTDVTQQILVCVASEIRRKSDVAKKKYSKNIRTLVTFLFHHLSFQLLVC